jgi:hypothetical protein
LFRGNEGGFGGAELACARASCSGVGSHIVEKDRTSGEPERRRALNN